MPTPEPTPVGAQVVSDEVSTPPRRSGRPLVLVSTSATDRYPDYWARVFNRPLLAAGALPLLFPVTEDAAARREALALADGLLLGGGWDIEPERFGAAKSGLLWQLDPRRDELELPLVGEALAAGVPILGTCRGMQVINVALGGTLYLDASLHPGAENHPSGGLEEFAGVVEAEEGGRDPDPEATTGHPITVDPASVLAATLGARRRVNSFHHQHLDRLGEGVVVTGRSDDGVAELIEVEHAAAPAIGVQWEAQTGWRGDPGVFGVFEFFVEAARDTARRRG